MKAKATITNLRILVDELRNKGVEVTFNEVAKNEKGKYYTGNTPYRQFGRWVGTSSQLFPRIISTYEILGLELPELR